MSDRPETKHANNLVQVPSPPKVPESGWKCEWEGCDLKTNLWLNLSSGKIYCGRSHFDGSGGKNHAIEHYKAEGSKYPLVVKLGTVSGGTGDVHSYDEDTLVTDPCLGAHLAHFGLEASKMVKTEKTMKELEEEAAAKLS